MDLQHTRDGQSWEAIPVDEGKLFGPKQGLFCLCCGKPSEIEFCPLCSEVAHLLMTERGLSEEEALDALIQPIGVPCLDGIVHTEKHHVCQDSSCPCQGEGKGFDLRLEF